MKPRILPYTLKSKMYPYSGCLSVVFKKTTIHSSYLREKQHPLGGLPHLPLCSPEVAFNQSTLPAFLGQGVSLSKANQILRPWIEGNKHWKPWMLQHSVTATEDTAPWLLLPSSLHLPWICLFGSLVLHSCFTLSELPGTFPVKSLLITLSRFGFCCLQPKSLTDVLYRLTQNTWGI